MTTMTNAWHKNSRFWLVAPVIVILVLLIGTGVLLWRDTHSAEALQMIGMVVAVFLGGAGVKSGVDEYRKPRTEILSPQELEEK